MKISTHHVAITGPKLCPFYGWEHKFLVTHPMTDHCESCLSSTIAAERANHLRHRAPKNDYLELLRALEGTLSRWSRLHLQSLAPTNPHWARVLIAKKKCYNPTRVYFMVTLTASPNLTQQTVK
ncbi:hypothetical protein evm_011220 [Chilo suppressalis]|nr:hypothetical protein evm_011220 [Chilo suppressalis]